MRAIPFRTPSIPSTSRPVVSTAFLRSNPHTQFRKDYQSFISRFAPAQNACLISRRLLSTDGAPSLSISEAETVRPERKAWRAAPHRRPDEPVYELYFTCKSCKTRSSHSISKQGYHNGTVLVQCPGCNNRHLISDHLKIFYDHNVTLEDILKEKGETVKLGSLDQQGDLELWDERAADAAESRRPNTGSA